MVAALLRRILGNGVSGLFDVHFLYKDFGNGDGFANHFPDRQGIFELESLQAGREDEGRCQYQEVGTAFQLNFLSGLQIAVAPSGGGGFATIAETLASFSCLLGSCPTHNGIGTRDRYPAASYEGHNAGTKVSLESLPGQRSPGLPSLR